MIKVDFYRMYLLTEFKIRQIIEPQNNEVIGFCLTGNVCTHVQLLHPGTGDRGPWSEPASAGLGLG